MQLTLAKSSEISIEKTCDTWNKSPQQMQYVGETKFESGSAS